MNSRRAGRHFPAGGSSPSSVSSTRMAHSRASSHRSARSHPVTTTGVNRSRKRARCRFQAAATSHRIVRAGRCEQGGGPNASHLEEPHTLVAGCAQVPVAARAHQPVRLHHQILHDRPGRPVIETRLLPREHGCLHRRERLPGLQDIRLGQPAVRVNHDPRRRGRRPVAMGIRDSGEQLANPRNKGCTQSHRVSTPRRERRKQRPALIPAQRGHIGAIPR